MSDEFEVEVALIVAMAENCVIGRDNQLPWYLPEDLKYFKKVTMGKPIVMGRKTFESIGKPLPGRTNIVVTRNADFQPEGVRVVSTVEQAIALGKSIAIVNGVREIMVIGGAEIYEACLPVVDRLYLTHVHAEVEGDAYFPVVDWADWSLQISERFEAEGGNPYDYSFAVYQRAG